MKTQNTNWKELIVNLGLTFSLVYATTDIFYPEHSAAKKVLIALLFTAVGMGIISWKAFFHKSFSNKTNPKEIRTLDLEEEEIKRLKASNKAKDQEISELRKSNLAYEMKLHELEEELKMNDLPIVKGKVEPTSRKYYLTNFVLIQFVCREYGISQDKLEIALESFFDKRGITGMKQRTLQGCFSNCKTVAMTQKSFKEDNRRNSVADDLMAQIKLVQETGTRVD